MRCAKITAIGFLLVAGATHAAAGEVARSSPAQIGTGRQFWFNAQELIADSKLVRVFQARPVKHPCNPLLVADRPWEGTVVQLYSCDVHYDPLAGRWQMWYEGHPAGVLLCTAFSTDGIHWSKPDLGIEDWQGSRANNIVLQTGYWDAHCASIVKAPTEKDPARRYKLYYWVGPQWFDKNNPVHLAAGNKITQYTQNGHHVAFSEDGVHFVPKTDAPAINSSDFNTTLFDQRRGKYRSYHKIDRQLPGWDMPRRCMSMSESDDGVHFGESIPVLAPDETDDAQARARGCRRVEFYGMHVWPYEDFYLGIVWYFPVTGMNAQLGRGWDDARIEPHLIYSPDGIAWKRLPVREPFIPCGPAGSFEAGTIYSAGDRPVIVGDEVWFYYFGVSYTHGNAEPVHSLENYSGIGLAKLPRDRYVGWLAGTATGTLLTKPLVFSGKEMHLNLDASRGEVRVALLDAEGKPLPGWGLEDCTPISGDHLDHTAKWNSVSDLSALSGSTVRIQFALRQSVLYTWQFR